MKALKTSITSLLLCLTGAAFAQVTTSPAQPAPQQVPVQEPTTTTPSVDKKAELNYPQSPNRPANIPSEDTLIKGQRTSGAVIQDSLMPSSTDKKADRMERRKKRKGTSEMGDSTSTQNDPAKKP